jgi:ATP-dependent DNA helicase RecG
MKSESESLQYIKGVGPKRAEAFVSEGITNEIALACYFPRDYVSRDSASSIKDLAAKLFRIEALDESTDISTRPLYQEFSIVAKVIKKHLHEFRSRKMLELTLSDGSGSQASIVFWQRAQYFEKRYNEGDTLAVSGKPEIDGKGKIVFSHPEIEQINEEEKDTFETGKILP